MCNNIDVALEARQRHINREYHLSDDKR
jgi:hypothetical protein